jgi:hypothetical protein
MKFFNLFNNKYKDLMLHDVDEKIKNKKIYIYKDDTMKELIFIIDTKIFYIYNTFIDKNNRYSTIIKNIYKINYCQIKKNNSSKYILEAFNTENNKNIIRFHIDINNNNGIIYFIKDNKDNIYLRVCDDII